MVGGGGGVPRCTLASLGHLWLTEKWTLEKLVR